MSKRKQTCIDLKRKVEILQGVDRGLKSKTEIAKHFKIPKSTLSTIIKNKELIY
jgi:DNA invertase Pin-like site-specific DNA recombinase